jgi:hypothetical protein
MGGGKGEQLREEYQGQVGWNDHEDHRKEGVLGGFQKLSGVWIG